MNIVRLYGKGATTVIHGKDEIRSSGGQINVPETLVAHMLGQGWSRYPLREEPEDELHKLDAPAVVALMPGAPIGGGFELADGEGPE